MCLPIPFGGTLGPGCLPAASPEVTTAPIFWMHVPPGPSLRLFPASRMLSMWSAFWLFNQPMVCHSVPAPRQQAGSALDSCHPSSGPKPLTVAPFSTCSLRGEAALCFPSPSLLYCVSRPPRGKNQGSGHPEHLARPAATPARPKTWYLPCQQKTLPGTPPLPRTPVSLDTASPQSVSRVPEHLRWAQLSPSGIRVKLETRTKKSDFNKSVTCKKSDERLS